MAAIFALAGAMFYALASVLQQREASTAPPDQSLRLGLLLGLIRRPVWLAGVVADLAGFGFEALALHNGPLSLVQPLLTVGLVFALGLGAMLTGGALTRRDWTGAVAVTGGLVLFLTQTTVGSGRQFASDQSWLIAGLATATLGALCLVASRLWATGSWRSVLLATATGLVFALSAALTKTATYLLAQGVKELVTSWEFYALVAVGLTSMVLAQSAFQSGTLRDTLPALTIVPPAASLVLGEVLFIEHLKVSGVGIPLAIIGVVLALGGLLVLSTSPLAAAAYGSRPEEQDKVEA
jgi:drug/metabolite transporter (DMT)-like permease